MGRGIRDLRSFTHNHQWLTKPTLIDERSSLKTKERRYITHHSDGCAACPLHERTNVPPHGEHAKRYPTRPDARVTETRYAAMLSNEASLGRRDHTTTLLHISAITEQRSVSLFALVVRVNGWSGTLKFTKIVFSYRFKYFQLHS